MKEYPLTKKQIRILKLAYKFRFVTVHQLADHLGLAISTMSTNIKVLYRRGLLERRYTNLDIKLGLSAQYYLSNKGISELKKEMPLNDSVVRSYYKNKSLSRKFVDHNIAIFSAYLTLRRQYHQQFTILTKAEIADYEQFPELKPDLFLQSDTVSYFLYLYTDTQLFVIQKHVKQIIQHENEGSWPGDYPSVLIACPSPRIEHRLQKYLESLLEDFEFYTTTTKALLAEKPERAIWSDPVEPEKLINLN